MISRNLYGLACFSAMVGFINCAALNAADGNWLWVWLWAMPAAIWGSLALYVLVTQ